MKNNNTLLELKNVEKSYRMNDEQKPLPVLKNTSLKVKGGESIAITGPSGSGKSTLLNILGALDMPDNGSVIFDHKDISSYNEQELALFRNKNLGFIFQLHHLLPHLTVLENVLLPTIPFQKENSDNISKAKKLLKDIGLSQRMNHIPGQLSGGERQRTAVVRALINEPELLLADEPTGSLDHKNALDLVKLLKEFNQSKELTLIMVTHSKELAKYMSKEYSLTDGFLK